MRQVKTPLVEDVEIVELTIFDGISFATVRTATQMRVFDVLRKQEIYINSPCSGRGTCGKCKVTVIEGRLLSENCTDKDCSIAEPGQSVLACLSFVIEKCTIDISSLQERDFFGVADFAAQSVDPVDAGYEMLEYIPTKQTWQAGQSITAAICAAMKRELTFSPKALRQLSDWFNLSLQNQYSAPGEDNPVILIVQENRAIQVRADKSAPIYGSAVDIGTTTIALSLVNLESGVVENNLTLLNSQRRFGADVISRIQKSAEGCIGELQNCVVADIAHGIAALCPQKRDSVISMVIAGNTTMIHFLLGLRADSLASFPFNPVTNATLELTSTDLFGEFPVDCNITVLPSIGAYLGADIIAGMLYCNFDRTKKLAVLIDVGTNGEMALGCSDRILCTSTAAGPAFEGANITFGTGSVPGAIDRFDIQAGQPVIRTIANEDPVGICGSGVVDIVAVGLRENLIDFTGRLQVPDTMCDSLEIAKNKKGTAIRFTQKDVREFQLAKAAIRSGLEILLREYGCGWTEVEKVYLAGGFGTKIDVDNAIAVGLFPGELRGKIQAVGNSALAGCVAYLLNRQRRQAVNSLRKTSSVIDLSRQPEFNDLFVSQLQFA